MLEKISRRSLFLLCLDACIIAFSIEAGGYVRSGEWSFVLLMEPFSLTAFFLFLTAFYVFDLYYPFKYFLPTKTFSDISLAVLLATFALAGISYFDRSFLIARPVFLVAAMMIFCGAFLLRMLYDILFRARFLDKRAILIGTGSLARRIIQILCDTPHTMIDLVGLLHHDESLNETTIGGIPVLGGTEHLLSLIDWHNIEIVILAMEENEHLSEAALMSSLMKQKVKTVSAVYLIERLEEAIPHELVDQHYLLRLMSEVRFKNYLKVKRLMDIVFSVLLLIILLPVSLAAYVLLGAQDFQKIFFVQTRIGKDGIPFKLIKFRSMIESKTGEKHISRIGKWLRKYRIDEIPQLVNVLKGDMSLIGPRPEIAHFVEKCRKNIPLFDTSLAIKPGLTGWAQVKFKYTTSERDYARKFCYNLYYLKNMSLGLDLLILIKTVRTVLWGKGQ